MLLEAARMDDGHCMYRLAHADAFSLAHVHARLAHADAFSLALVHARHAHAGAFSLALVHARLAHADAFSLAHARLVYELGGFRRADVTCSEIRQVQEG